MEAVARDEFRAIPESALREAIAEWWLRHASNAWQELSHVEWLGEVPPLRRWRHFERVRAQATDSAVLHERSRRTAQTGTRVVAVEKAYSSAEPPLHGRIDRIEEIEGEIVLVDLKSGRSTAEIRPQHRTQLLLYAALLRASGITPSSAVIEYLDGNRVGFKISWAEVDELLDHALGIYDSVASALQAEDYEDRLGALAVVSPETCGHCRFRLACRPFHSAVRTDPELDGTFATGVVSHIEKTHAGVVATLERATGSVPVIRIVGIPESVQVGVGDLVSATDLVMSRNTIDRRITWESALVIWDINGQVRSAFPARVRDRR